MDITALQARLTAGEKVLLDGAMGTEILNRGFSTALPLWSAEVLFDNPEVVQAIHEDYIRAGAEIIVTNTFSTTTRVLAKQGLGARSGEITLLAGRLARQARDAAGSGNEIYIAGSVSPLEDCYRPELTPAQDALDTEHLELAANLKDSGADFILIETMITIRETMAAIRAAQATGLPFAVSFCCNDRSQLLGGQDISEAIETVQASEPLFVGVNCVSPKIATQTVRQLRRITRLPLCVYAQGDGEPDDSQGWKVAPSALREAYTETARTWLRDGAQVIGSCCGSTPAYTADLRRIV